MPFFRPRSAAAVRFTLCPSSHLGRIDCLLEAEAHACERRQAGAQPRSSDAEDLPGRGIPTWVWVAGLGASAALCTAVLSPLLKMAVWQPLAAVAVALLVAVLAVRALGETDLVRLLLPQKQAPQVAMARLADSD